MYWLSQLTTFLDFPWFLIITTYDAASLSRKSWHTLKPQWSSEIQKHLLFWSFTRKNGSHHATRRRFAFAGTWTWPAWCMCNTVFLFDWHITSLYDDWIVVRVILINCFWIIEISIVFLIKYVIGSLMWLRWRLFQWECFAKVRCQLTSTQQCICRSGFQLFAERHNFRTRLKHCSVLLWSYSRRRCVRKIVRWCIIIHIIRRWIWGNVLTFPLASLLLT